MKKIIIVCLLTLIAVTSFSQTTTSYSIDSTSNKYDNKISLGFKNGIGNTQMIDFKMQKNDYKELKQWLQNMGYNDIEEFLWDKIKFGANYIKNNLQNSTSLEYIQSEENSINFYEDYIWVNYYIKAQNGIGNTLTAKVRGSIKYKREKWVVDFYLSYN